MALRMALSQGLIGGVSGAGCMTAVRMVARSLGWIDATPPQATREWLRRGVFRLPANATGSRQLIDALVHLSIGAGGGVAYGALVPVRNASLATGAVFGLSFWAFAFGVLTPGLGITRSPLRGSWRETAVNVTAHLIYGAITALVASELKRQTEGLDASVRALRSRVG